MDYFELYKNWEEALKMKDMKKLEEYALKIEKMGEEILKKYWDKVKVGDKAGDILEKEKLGENEIKK